MHGGFFRSGLHRARALALTGDGRQVRRNGWIGLLCLAAAQDTDFSVGVGVDGIRLVLHPHPDAPTQQIHFHNSTPSIGRIHKGLRLGAGLQQVFIGVLLVFQAAHKPAAGTGNLSRVQTQVLGLGHFDGNRLEVIQKLGAAEGPSADAQATYHFGFVPDTNLPQLNPGSENAGQILDQFPEVHPVV